MRLSMGRSFPVIARNSRRGSCTNARRNSSTELRVRTAPIQQAGTEGLKAGHRLILPPDAFNLCKHGLTGVERDALRLQRERRHRGLSHGT